MTLLVRDGFETSSGLRQKSFRFSSYGNSGESHYPTVLAQVLELSHRCGLLTLTAFALGILLLSAQQTSAQEIGNTTKGSATKAPTKAELKKSEVTHRFIAFGSETYVMEANGERSWTYPAATRDGYVLSDGRFLLVLSKSKKKYKGGALVIVDPKTDEETLLWKGTQSEVNSVHPTDEGNFVLTEAGDKPRLLEIDAAGKVLVEFDLKCQKKNHHMQTRMVRKLADGSYLAPHLLNFAVFQYDAEGNVLSQIDTTVEGDPQRKIHSWPFTAIRHSDNQTLVCMTNGNRVADFDADGKIVWQLTNEDLPGEWLQDPCGGQVLPNGNIVIASYAAGRKDAAAPKLIEVNRDKEVVWTYSNGKKKGIHHFQILSTNGEALSASPQK